MLYTGRQTSNRDRNPKKMKLSPILIVITFLAITLFTLSGCNSQQELKDEELKVVWQKYYGRYFEESFYEKLTSNQRKELMKEIAEEYSISYNQLMYSLKSKYPQKFDKLFY